MNSLDPTQSRSRSGISALEMIIAIGLLLTILGIVGRFQMSTAGVLTTTSSRGQLNETCALPILDPFCAETTSEAASLVVSAQNGSTRLDFSTPIDYVGGNPVWSTPITYQINLATVDWNGDGVVSEGRLVRIQNGATTVLCDYIIPGGFTATLAGSNVLVQLQLTKMDKNTRRLLRANEQTSISFRN